MQELTIYLNNQVVKHVPITAKSLIIGRDKYCDIILRDKTVSKRHAMILRHNDQCYIEDMGSTNTTQVNYRETHQHKLKHNDLITIGRFQLVFSDDSNLKSEQ